MQIMEVLIESNGYELWSLTSAHMKQLLQAFPSCKGVLECLLDNDNIRPCSNIVCQRLVLAKLGLLSREQEPMLGWCWNLKLAVLEGAQKMETPCTLSSPNTLQTSDGQTFLLDLVFEEREEGLCTIP